MNTYQSRCVWRSVLSVGIAAITAASSPAMAPRPTNGSNLPPPLQTDQIVNNKQELECANTFFKGKLIFDEPADPMRILNCVVIIKKDGQRGDYTPLLPDEPRFKTELVKDSIFEAIIDRSVSGNVAYLAFVTANLSAEDKAAVSINAVVRGSGFGRLSPKVKEAMPDAISALVIEPGDRMFFVEAAQVVVATSTVLHKNSGGGKAAFVVTIGADALYTDSRTTTHRFVAAEAVEVKLAPAFTKGPEENEGPSRPTVAFGPADFEGIVVKSTSNSKAL